MPRIPIAEVETTLAAILRKSLFSEDRAALCSRLFAETTRDGVYSHGVNRFPRFLAMVRNGSVDPAAEPIPAARFGALERWDGRRGPGNLNAHAAMAHAIRLSRSHGIACIALANTNHWMRGGSYGWQAADAGVIAICWTNTLPNLPPWGAAKPAIGNNPLVLAIPRAKGHLVLDIAMSQFSYGALESYRKRGELLPVDGGFDADGRPSRIPAAIEATQRLLPIGYWKGSGLSVALDMIAAMLSLGNATHQIPTHPLRETGLSQVFLAIDPRTIADAPQLDAIAGQIIASLHSAPRADIHIPVRYPGENTLRLRDQNLRLGLPVDPDLWTQITAL